MNAKIGYCSSSIHARRSARDRLVFTSPIFILFLHHIMIIFFSVCTKVTIVYRRIATSASSTFSKFSQKLQRENKTRIWQKIFCSDFKTAKKNDQLFELGLFANKQFTKFCHLEVLAPSKILSQQNDQIPEIYAHVREINKKVKNHVSGL